MENIRDGKSSVTRSLNSRTSNTERTGTRGLCLQPTDISSSLFFDHYHYTNLLVKAPESPFITSRVTNYLDCSLVLVSSHSVQFND